MWRIKIIFISGLIAATPKKAKKRWNRNSWTSFVRRRQFYSNLSLYIPEAFKILIDVIRRRTQNSYGAWNSGARGLQHTRERKRDYPFNIYFRIRIRKSEQRVCFHMNQREKRFSQLWTRHCWRSGWRKTKRSTLFDIHFVFSHAIFERILISPMPIRARRTIEWR